MALPVILKSGKNYMTIVLDDQIDFSQLLQEIVVKFKEAEKFFGHTPIALMFEGRELSSREENIILDAIDEFTCVKVSTILDPNEVSKLAVELALKLQEEPMQEELDFLPQNSTFVERDVEDGEVIEAKGSLVVFGSVSEGAILRAQEDIVVLGQLYGQALAGLDGKDSHFIYAGGFHPVNFRIHSCLGQAVKKKGLWKSSKFSPRIARICNGEMQVQPYS